MGSMRVDGDEKAFAGFEQEGAIDGGAVAVEDGGEEDTAGLGDNVLQLVGEVEKDLETLILEGALVAQDAVLGSYVFDGSAV